MATKTGIMIIMNSGMGRCHSVKLKNANTRGSRIAIPIKYPTATSFTRLQKLIPFLVILIFMFFEIGA